MPHDVRSDVASSEPLLVTMKVREELASLRTKSAFECVLRALGVARARFGVRIAQWSVQRDHVHLLVEARDGAALGRAMQGLAVRLARALNRLRARRGKVFRDRYHHRTLTKPTQVRNAIAYVLCNARKHRVTSPRTRFDRFSSALAFDGWRGGTKGEVSDGPVPVAAPRTWLLRVGWRKVGATIDAFHVPSSAPR